MQKFRSVQVLRGVAALAVAWGHIYQGDQGLAVPVNVSAAGVDLFFVISGFIMATVSQGRRPAAFLADRAWRIYPLWLIAMVPWLVTIEPRWQAIVASFTLWPVYPAGYFGPALGLGWTLGFEMIFYCAVALALATRAAVPVALYALCLVLGVVTNSTLFGYLGSPMALEFLAGVVIAHLPRRDFRLAPLVVATALAALFVYTLHQAPEVNAITPRLAAARVVGWGVPCALIFYSVLCMDSRFGSPRFSAAVFLGDASYALYLFHKTIAFGVHLPGMVRLVIAIAVALAVHVLLERRIMRWKRSKTERRSLGRKVGVDVLPLCSVENNVPGDKTIEPSVDRLTPREIRA